MSPPGNEAQKKLEREAPTLDKDVGVTGKGGWRCEGESRREIDKLLAIWKLRDGKK